MKNKLNKIALYFTAVVLLLLVASQGLLFVFEFELNRAEGGFFGMLEILSKYQALDNIWFALSSQALAIVMFIILFIFVIKEIINKRR